ncbi:MAG: hypothetical protein ACI4J6_09825 [Oscillospiraceae bacterium]
MSTKRSFGRFTAMGLAGLTAVSSMAVIAEAASAYSAYVYEFQYTGAKTIEKNAYAKAQAAANKFVVEETGVTVTSEFAFGLDNGTFRQYNSVAENDFAETATIADNFGLGENNTLWFNKDGGNWTYMDKVTGDAITAEEKYLDRADGTSDTGFVAFFKSKAERDSAKSKIISDVKSDYTSKYNAALSALKADLSTASTAKKNAELAAAKQKKEDDTKAAAVTRDNAIEAAGDDKDAIKAAKDDYSDAVKTINDTYNDEVKTANENYKLRSEVITTVAKEFAAVYAPANFDFDAGFKIDDTAPEVTYTIVSGGVVFETASYTGRFGADLDDLTTAYYRKNGAYIAPARYAFTGEITNKANISKSEYDISVNWVAFTDLIKGNSSSGNTTTSDDKDKDKDKDKETTTVTGEWYPGSSVYRTYNTNGLSYLGKNGKWYTSASAAEAYGGGYAGQYKTSNYDSVKSSNVLYFSADDGNYYTTAAAAGSHSYIVKNVTTTTNNDDPYYYYYMMGNGSTTTIDPDAPAIYGSKKRSGWDRISTYIKASKSGSTVKIKMNAATTVPASVLATAKDKGVTLMFINENGSKVTVKPGSVSTYSALDVSVVYNVKNIRSSLVTAAKKVNPGTVSTAQIQVGTSGSFGGTVTTTVKMPTKRAGDTVKAYRLTDSGKLTREATGVIKADGTLSLNLKNGGSYLLVVIE